MSSKYSKCSHSTLWSFYLKSIPASSSKRLKSSERNSFLFLSIATLRGTSPGMGSYGKMTYINSVAVLWVPHSLWDVVVGCVSFDETAYFKLASWSVTVAERLLWELSAYPKCSWSDQVVGPDCNSWRCTHWVVLGPTPLRTLLVISAKKMPFLLINLKMENPVEKAVNEATADTLQMPDQKLMK